MHACITALTLFATLFHFTVGCCGHVHADTGHGGAASELHEFQVCDHGCDHGHAHAAEIGVEMATGDDLVDPLHTEDGDCPADECHGCSCKATHDVRPLDMHGIGVDFFTIAWIAPAVVLTQSAVSGAWEAADPPVRAVIAPPLSERLLV